MLSFVLSVIGRITGFQFAYESHGHEHHDELGAASVAAIALKKSAGDRSGVA